MKNADCSVASRDSDVASHTGLQVGIFQARVGVRHSLVWFAKVWKINGSCVGGEGGRETGGSDSELRSLADSPHPHPCTYSGALGRQVTGKEKL